VADYELVDTIVGLEGRRCAGGKKSSVCDYLFRVCYVTNTQTLHTTEDINATQCALYELACSDVNSKKTEKETCLETCIHTYYSHLLSLPERKFGTAFNVHPESALKCIVEYEHKASSARIFDLNKHFKHPSAGDGSLVDSYHKDSGSWISMINEESSSLLSYEELSTRHDLDQHTISSLNTTVVTMAILFVVTLIVLIICLFYACRNGIITAPFQITRTYNNPEKVQI
jgi:hypothetical protein